MWRAISSPAREIFSYLPLFRRKLRGDERGHDRPAPPQSAEQFIVVRLNTQRREVAHLQGDPAGKSLLHAVNLPEVAHAEVVHSHQPLRGGEVLDLVLGAAAEMERAATKLLEDPGVVGHHEFAVLDRRDRPAIVVAQPHPAELLRQEDPCGKQHRAAFRADLLLLTLIQRIKASVQNSINSCTVWGYS